MAGTAGKAGSGMIGSNVIAELNDSSITIDMQIAEDSSFGDTAVTRITGLYDTSVDLAGHMDYTDTNGQKALFDAALAGTAQTNVRVATGAASAVTCASMRVSSVTINSSVGADPVAASYSLVGNGTTSWGGIS